MYVVATLHVAQYDVTRAMCAIEVFVWEARLLLLELNIRTPGRGITRGRGFMRSSGGLRSTAGKENG